MNKFEIVILAIALVLNSLSVYIGAGIILAREAYGRKAIFGSIMFVVQFLMVGAGIWIGYKMGSYAMQTNMIISVCILVIFGLNVLLTNINANSRDEVPDFTNNSVIVLAALAEGITPLSIGIAFGLVSLQLVNQWLLTGVIMLVGIISGISLGSRLGSNSRKLRFGPVGGLLILAVAIKLIINMMGF